MYSMVTSVLSPNEPEGPVCAEAAPQREVDPDQRVGLQQPRQREVARIDGLEAQLRHESSGDLFGCLVVTANEHDGRAWQLRMAHHRSADLVHGLAHPRTRGPRRD